MIIAHNMLAANAMRNYKTTVENKKKSTEKLSSGFKINRAADNAAGLSISEKMRSQIRGLNQGVRNIQDGISVCQVMDGALNEIHDILHRMTQLSVQAANDTLAPEDRYAIQQEINQLVYELDRTTSSAEFNTKPLFTSQERAARVNDLIKGEADIIFVVDNTGSMNSPINNVVNNLSAFTNSLSGYDIQYGVVEFGDLGSKFEASPFMQSEDDVKQRLSQIHTGGGGRLLEENALEGIMKALDYPFRGGSATKEIILVTDAGFHDKSVDGYSDFTDKEVAQALKAKDARLSVVTRKQHMPLYENNLVDDGMMLDIFSDFHSSLAELAEDIAHNAGTVEHLAAKDICIHMGSSADDYMFIHDYIVNSKTLGLSNLDCSSHKNACDCLEKIDNALDQISDIRSTIGADQNRLEHALEVNKNSSVNTQDAESRIRDTDIAKEIVNLSKQQILDQVGVSMITQANQNPQGILSLLS